MTRYLDARHRERSKEQAQRRLQEVSDIGEIPAIVNAARRRKTSKSFKAFCETYFKDVFYLKWSPIHLETIKAIESTVVKGTIQCLALPRGAGKTSLCQAAIVWALCTGRRRFGVLIAANQTRANQLLNDIKTWFETNELLLEDFPEIVYPIRKLEGISQRQRAQTYHGEKTAIDWKSGVLVLPTIAKSKASGSRLAAIGLTGSGLRGLSAATREGEKLRPDLVLADDPQDAESADSLEQTEARERIIKADVLGMAGPGKKIALLLTTTVIRADDLADRLLDHSRNPEFRGKRYSLVDGLPERMDLWRRYADIRAVDFENGGDGAPATEFYRVNQKEMDKGCKPTWPDRYSRDDELSAIQNAMNLYFRDESSFRTEYQNEPVDATPDATVIDSVVLTNAATSQPRGWIPDDADFLTAFIDVHKTLLFYAVCAFNRNFDGTFVEWGTYPKQNRSVFELGDAFPDLFIAAGTNALDAAVYRGLAALTDSLFERQYVRDDGTEISLERLGIDAGWTHQIVLKYIRESARRPLLFPSLGRHYGAATRQIDDYKSAQTTRRGDHWLWYRDPVKAPTGQVMFDANYWKTRLLTCLNAKPGDESRLRVDGTFDEQRLLIKHLGAEFMMIEESNGARKEVWKPKRKGWTDNHLLDCFVGCLVGASINGAKTLGSPDETRRKTRRRRSFADFKRLAAHYQESTK